MGFSRQEDWSGLPCPPPGDLPNPGIEPRSPTLKADSLPSEPPGKPLNTGVGNLSLLQAIFPTQELNRRLLHCWWVLYQLSYQGLSTALAMPAFSLSLNVACSDPPQALDFEWGSFPQLLFLLVQSWLRYDSLRKVFFDHPYKELLLDHPPSHSLPLLVFIVTVTPLSEIALFIHGLPGLLRNALTAGLGLSFVAVHADVSADSGNRAGACCKIILERKEVEGGWK